MSRDDFVGEPVEVMSHAGKSPRSIEDAIKAAIADADIPDGTTLVVTQIEIETVGDPNVGSYKVVLHKPGG